MLKLPYFDRFACSPFPLRKKANGRFATCVKLGKVVKKGAKLVYVVSAGLRQNNLFPSGLTALFHKVDSFVSDFYNKAPIQILNLTV